MFRICTAVAAFVFVLTVVPLFPLLALAVDTAVTRLAWAHAGISFAVLAGVVLAGYIASDYVGSRCTRAGGAR
ncbi:hypothetical protein GCM10012275_64560 [Longimycelium tulufanense]|uniref:Uncharacterized protein n=1 Tax=Longimycelium tulufanense TaxID=907463 RepID=A0A8J3CLF9_9PSEU|nr:hypothetical protein [Longimycelium tulufanense]GGM84901.1 hypothetical protein GCM10012275_64560 [Longimycelium tulufanense]